MFDTCPARMIEQVLFDAVSKERSSAFIFTMMILGPPLHKMIHKASLPREKIRGKTRRRKRQESVITVSNENHELDQGRAETHLDPQGLFKEHKRIYCIDSAARDVYSNTEIMFQRNIVVIAITTE